MKIEKPTPIDSINANLRDGRLVKYIRDNSCSSCDRSWSYYHKGNGCLDKENSVWPLQNILKGIRDNNDTITLSEITNLIAAREELTA